MARHPITPEDHLRAQARFERDCRIVELWVRWFCRASDADLGLGTAVGACRRWAQRSRFAPPSPRAVRIVLGRYFDETLSQGALLVERCELRHGGGARP